MKAVVVESCGQATWREVGDPPEPGPYEALVRVTAFSICNATDLHIRDCQLFGVSAADCPLLLGHEAVGEVVATGPHCRYVREGHQILRPMLRLPGFSSYWGGMAEYGIVTDIRSHWQDGSPPGPQVRSGHQIVPRQISPTDAVVLITLKEVLSYLWSLDVHEGSRLLVTGHGPVGLAAAYLGKLAVGTDRVIIAGRRPEAERQVRQFMADGYVDTREDGWPRTAMDMLGGPADAVVETTGNAEVTAAALEALASEGILGPYAARTADQQQAADLPDDRRIGPSGTDEGLSHDELVTATLRGQVAPDRFISHRLAPEEIARGFELIEAREALKIVFEL